MRQDGGPERLDDPGPLPQALGLDPMLDPAIEEHLHADADAEHRAAAREPAIDHDVASHCANPGHARSERPDPWEDERAGAQGGIEVSGDGDGGTDMLERPLGRPQIAGPVVEDEDVDGAHAPVRVPLVDGTPTTRTSRATASRRDRATDLNCASTT
ncbi:unannotated protein [freshwater metagenome]|uniref:Unannotated protein n=1 Tax=freshwater metagenome TaxID=449393 RepID=A0A6J7EN69_9ZZZZ